MATTDGRGGVPCLKSGQRVDGLAKVEPCGDDVVEMRVAVVGQGNVVIVVEVWVVETIGYRSAPGAGWVGLSRVARL